MNRFVYCNTHPKCHDLCDWFHVLELGDHEKVMKQHSRVTHNLLQKSLSTENSESIATSNPTVLAAKYLNNLTKLWLEGHKEVYVNRNGGFLLPFEGQVIYKTRETKEFVFPQDAPDPKECITALRYSDGSHWYLTSNKGRIFSEKHNTLESATREALSYVTEENFKVGDPSQTFRYTREGD